MLPKPENPPQPERSLRPGLLKFSGALLMDLLAFGAALSGRLPGILQLIALLIHAGACGLCALALHQMMPPSQQNPRRAALLFLFVVTFFLPVFGGLGMLGGIIAEYFYPKPKPQLWMSVPIPGLPHQPPAIAANTEYGDGALSAMLRYCPDPERRLSAVLTARRLRDANDTEVLQLALTDRVDDVRLLAYSVLDHKDQAFNERLKTLLRQLQTAPVEQQSQLRKRLAQTHFEMIHLGLARGEVQSYLLDQARKHIDAALQLEAKDCESLFLLGIIAVRQGEFETAEKAFLKAQVLGMALEKVLPYLAEVAFRQKRFATVTHYMRAINSFYFHTQPLLSGIAAHWLPEEP